MHPELFLRTLGALIDEIFLFQEGAYVRCEQSLDEVKRNSFIKDHVRGYKPDNSQQHPPEESVTARLVSCMLGLTRGMSSANNVYLARLSLSTLQQYIGWVDVNIVASGTVSETLFASLLYPPLASASVACVLELVNKGMDDDSKVSLIADLCLFERLHHLPLSQDNDYDLPQNVAEVINSAGLQLLASLDKHEAQKASSSPEMSYSSSSSSSSSSFGNGNGSGGAPFGRRPSLGSLVTPTLAASRAPPLLHQASALLLRYLGCGVGSVSTRVLPFASKLAATMLRQSEEDERGASSGGGGSGSGTSTAASSPRPFAAVAYLPSLLATAHVQMKYPLDHDFDYESSSAEGATTTTTATTPTGADEEDGGDNEDEEASSRVEARKLYCKLVRCSPSASLQFLCGVLESLPSPLSSAPFPDVEAALRLVFHYHEGLGNNPNAKNSTHLTAGPFPSVIAAIHNSGVGYHPHAEIRALYVEIGIKYNGKVLQGAGDLQAEEARQQMALPVLECISWGLQHQEKAIRNRFCYLFLNFVKQMGDGGGGHFTERAIAVVQGFIQANSFANYSLITTENNFLLFETLGVLINSAAVPPAAQQSYLQAFTSPQISSIKNLLQGGAALFAQSPGAGSTVAMLLSTITHLSKGFKKDTISVECQSIFAYTFNELIVSVHVAPSDASIRSKIVTLIHRMIELLGEGVLPYVPTFLPPLVHCCKEEDIGDVGKIMNKLLIQFRSKVASGMDAALQSFLRRCMELTPASDSTLGSASQLLVEGLAVKKIYTLFLQHLVAYDCASVLLSPTNAPCFEGVLNAMLDGIRTKDPNCKKTSVMFFTKFCEYEGRSGQQNPAYWSFLFGSVLTSLVGCMMDRESFSVKDANCNAVLSETAVLLCTIRSIRGRDELSNFAAALHNFAGGRQETETILRGLADCDNPNAMKDTLKAFLNVLP